MNPGQFRLKAKMEVHGGPVYALAAGHAPGLILSGGSDKRVVSSIIAEQTQGPLLFKLPSKVYSIAFDSDSGYYYFGNGHGQVHIVDYISAREIKCLQLHEGAMFSMLVYDRKIITGAEDGSIFLLDENGMGKKIETGTGSKVRMIRPADEQGIFLACLGNGELIMADTKGRILRRQKVHDGSCNAVLYLKNGYLITGGKDAYIRVLSAKTWKVEKEIPAHNWAVYDFALSKDGRFVSSASRDKTVKIWSAENLDFFQRLSRENGDGHQYSVNRLFWDHHSGLLVSAGDHRQLFIWENFEHSNRPD